MNEQAETPNLSASVHENGQAVVKVLSGCMIPYLTALQIWKHVIKKRATKNFDLTSEYNHGMRGGRVFKDATISGGDRRVYVLRTGLYIGCQHFTFKECVAFAKSQGWVEAK